MVKRYSCIAITSIKKIRYNTTLIKAKQQFINKLNIKIKNRQSCLNFDRMYGKSKNG